MKKDKQKNDKAKETENKWTIVEYSLFVGLLLIIVAPWLLTRTWGLFSFDSNTGPIGDTVGGITAPITGLLGAFLVYRALKEQITANGIFINQFDHQKKEDKANKLTLIVIEQLKLIREDIDKLNIERKFKNGKMLAYQSSEAIIEVMRLYPIHHFPEEERPLKLEYLLYKVDGNLRGINYLLALVTNADIYPEDKENLARLINETFETKLWSYVGTYYYKKESKQEICQQCNKRHGIPDHFLMYFDSIEEQLKKLKLL